MCTEALGKQGVCTEEAVGKQGVCTKEALGKQEVCTEALLEQFANLQIQVHTGVGSLKHICTIHVFLS